MQELSEGRKHTVKFPVPDLPRETWCDFRIDFEKGMTLVELAAKYYCDPRTVRRCIQHNKSSFELGRKSTPPRIQVFESPIRQMLAENTDRIPADISSIYGLSHYLYPLLREKGYSGSERTLRNHLQSQPYAKAILERRQSEKINHTTQEHFSGSETEHL